MMNKRQILYNYAVVVAALSLLCFPSCVKDDTTKGDCDAITLSLNGTTLGTRATLYNEVALTTQLTEGIGVYGINHSTSAVNIDNAQANYSSGSWKTVNAFVFASQRLDYVAYYPYNSSYITNRTCTATQLVFDYTEPTTYSDQKDVMVGSNNNSYAGYLWKTDDISMTMWHCLAAVKFKYGDLTNVPPGCTVTEVLITNVCPKKKCTAKLNYKSESNPGSDYVWFKWEYIAGLTPQTITAVPTVTTPTTDSDLGITFTVIPDVTTDSEIVVRFSNNTESRCKPAINWEAGKIYTYTLNFSSSPGSMSLPSYSEESREW